MQAQKGVTRLLIDMGPLAEGVKMGDSVAVNGCCLTVNFIQGSHRGFDLLQETLDRTNLSRLKPRSMVNLERGHAGPGTFRRTFHDRPYRLGGCHSLVRAKRK